MLIPSNLGKILQNVPYIIYKSRNSSTNFVPLDRSKDQSSITKDYKQSRGLRL